MASKKCVLKTEGGQYVQVVKADHQSLRLQLVDTHQPTRWFIQKQEQKRQVLLYENEESCYVLTFIEDSWKLHLKWLSSKEALDVTSEDNCQLEIDNGGRGDFYTLRYGKMFLATQDSMERQEIGLTEDAAKCLYIKDVEVRVNILWSALNATVQAPPPSGSSN